MIESFSKTSSKREAEQEINSGVQEYLRSKIEKIKDEREFIPYNTERAERPFSREEMEEDINDFVEKNLTTIASFIFNDRHSNEFNQFKILNKDLRNFGFEESSIVVEAVLEGGGYYRTVSEPENDSYPHYSYSDKLVTHNGAEFDYDLLKKNKMRVLYPGIGDGHNKFKDFSEFLATAYLKDSLRIDRKLDLGGTNSEHTKRYFFRKFGRYLCENDFGMKPFGGQADVSDIAPFAKFVQRHIRKVSSNIEVVERIVVGEKYNESPYFRNFRNELEREYNLPDDPGRVNPDRERIEAERSRIEAVIGEIIKQLKQRKLSEAFESTSIKELIFNAVPFAKFANEISLKTNPKIEAFIANDLGEESDLYKKLEYFESKKFRDGVRELVLSDFYTLPELGDIRIATSVAHGKPVVLEDENQVGELLNSVSYGYIEKIKSEIINSDSDERLRKVSLSVSSGRGAGSPYSFHSFNFYQSLKKVGVDNFLELYPQAKQGIFEENTTHFNLNINEFIDGVNGIYEIFGDKVARMDSKKINKEIWHNKMLDQAGIWEYFAARSSGAKKPEWDNDDYETSTRLHEEYNNKINVFFKNLSSPDRKKLFFEGKQMYWLAKQVQKKIWELDKNKDVQLQNEDADYEEQEEEEKDEFKFYYYHNLNWEQYDCKNIDLEKFSQYLGTHGNIICTLLATNNERDQIASNVSIETMMAVVEAMESGADMRGVALAFDKKKYFDGILSGEEQKNDLEYALKDWPEKLRKVISLEEFQVYFENAEQYLLQDPNGMIRYAKLLQEEPRMRSVLGAKIEKKSDLDLRLCLSVQDSVVRGWYVEGAEYIGHNALQKYFVRFQATRDRAGGYPNLHDSLYWIPNIKRVSPNEARALLDDIATVDESNELRDFLPRYDKEKDTLKANGAIGSLRELKKRVFALESNIDLSTLSPEILDIISAPGFNLSELKRLQRETRFADLVDGKLDKEQPFNPHVRKFTARPLNELLKEGMGSFKDKIRGTAQDPKGLFDSIRKLIKGREDKEESLQVQDLLREVPLDMEEDILRLLQEQRVPTGNILEATVHAKSDPEGWVCGNYTDCCMPFGDSKNTDYMFNKGTQYFTVKNNGRIIAQSVIVDSFDKETNEPVVVLDNIEVANNYKDRSAVLSRIYKTFWAEYTSKKVKIGTGYSDLIPDGAKLESNNYSPKHQISYSDARGSSIYDLPKIKGVESLDKILTFANLTERDAETIAEMEKMAYPEGFLQGKGEALKLIQKQRELNLPGAASSFIVRQGNEPAGYLLVLPEESKMDSSEKAAHIYDMVVLPKFQGGIVARKMMERLLDTAKAYDVPAIEFEAREGTSYRLITNPRIAKWVESKGYELAYDELLPEYLGGEDFYFVRLERILEDE